MTRSAEEAIAWAVKYKGKFGWDNLCLKFVREAFGVYYNPDSAWPTPSRNAGTAWDRAKIKHHTKDPMSIPRGVPVFFELPTVADHVVLSLGNGRCLGNDFVVNGRIDEAAIADIARRWGPLLGWTEDLVGNRIYQPPRPKKRPPVVQDMIAPLRDLKAEAEKEGRPTRARRLARAIRLIRKQFPPR